MQSAEVAIPPPTSHFNYDEMDDCQCALCTDYRQAVTEYKYWVAYTAKDTQDCDCFYCQRKAGSLEYLRIATAKREIYSELSFLTKGSPSHPSFMKWMSGVITHNEDKSGWWSQVAYNKPLKFWMLQWQSRFLPRQLWAVSGVY
jgi:hypothetical protein